MRPRTALLLLVALAAVAVPASAHAFRLDVLAPVRGNPAERLAAVPADPVVYDTAARCDPRPRVGTALFVAWLQRNVRGRSWGTYRCERWGKGSASLHAENRAVDWHLDVGRPADRRAARALITLLLAPDRAGTPHALARRMGVEEIIWDCSYWSAGMAQFVPYRACFDKKGEPRRHVGRTIAHRDHVHFGLTRAGAAGRTTFWRAVRGG